MQNELPSRAAAFDGVTEGDAEVARFYDRAPEEVRLEQGAGPLEEARTRELIQRYAPPPPAVVLDVGGGAGAYSFWLAGLGYQVHLVDASPRLIAEAGRRAGASRPLASCTVGDARSLEFRDRSAGVVLLLGPLYHLTAASDRVQALREAARVLKPGGWLFGAVISRVASALDALSRDLLQDPRFRKIVERDLAEGQHRNPTDRIDYFTTAYFHRPEEAVEEVRAAGFGDVRILGIEGPGWLLPDVEERIRSDRQRADLLDVARWLEEEPSALGVSAHLLVVGRSAR